TSPDTAKASVDARLFFIAMWCWADDYGIGETNLNALLGFAFPEDDQRERKEIQSLCKEVSEAYGVVFYTVRDRRFFAILSWDKHQKTQRRAARRNPGPDDPESVPDQRIYGQEGSAPPPQGISSRTQGNPPSGTGEQGNRGTGESSKKRAPAEPDAAKPKAVEQAVTERAYERVGKAFQFMPVRQLAKWAIHDRGADPDSVENAIVGIYEMGKPHTKTVMGQYLDGHLHSRTNGNGI